MRTAIATFLIAGVLFAGASFADRIISTARPSKAQVEVSAPAPSTAAVR
jgi:hypothetical protein